MLITCKCLNVSIDIKGGENDFSNVDIANLNLSRAEESDSFFKEELKEIEIAQVTKQVKSLVQIKTVGTWEIEYCLNCSTNCYSTSSGKTTALVNAALFTNTDVIGKMKTHKDYSPVFRIIIKPLVMEQNSVITNLRQSGQKDQTALSSLQQQLNEAIQEQVNKTEERIQIYTEQQYNQLEEFRNRATNDHKALVQRIYESQPQLDREIHGTTGNEIVSTYTDNTTTSINKKVLSRRKTDTFVVERSQQVVEQKGKKTPNRSINLFTRNSNVASSISSNTNNPTLSKELSLDSEGLFVLEGMEDSVTIEPGHSEGDSDTDHDDSGSHDEGIDVHRKRTSSFQLAKSLPVNVPVYSVPSIAFDKDEESMNSVDIAASIKALARSINGETVFGDLPRPRFSTQI